MDARARIGDVHESVHHWVDQVTSQEASGLRMRSIIIDNGGRRREEKRAKPARGGGLTSSSIRLISGGADALKLIHSQSIQLLAVRVRKTRTNGKLTAEIWMYVRRREGGLRRLKVRDE